MKKAIYAVFTTVVVTITLLTTAKMFPKVKLSETKNDKKIISSIEIANLNKVITSRSSDEVRNSTHEETIEKIQQEKKDSTKTEIKKIEKNEDTTIQESKTEKTTSIKDVKISKNMDLTVRTGLSREDFIKLISNVKYDTSGFFEENAGTIYDLCEEYSINEIFFCGLISAESGWNIASNHRKTHNYISLMSKGKLIHYNSLYEGLKVAAQKLHNNYLTPGGAFYHGKTLSGVKVCFCPSSTWVDLVYGRMEQIL